MIIAMVLLFTGISLFAQATGDYRSKANGNWNALTTWERYNGTTWAEPTAVQGAPTSSSGVITLRSPYTVTVTANVNADQATIQSGGQVNVNASITWTIANGTGTDLTVNGTLQSAGTVTATGTIIFSSTGVYKHNWSAGTVGTVPTATWNDGSLVEVINMTGSGATTKLQGCSQSFYDFKWNCPSQSQPVYIRGDSFRPIRHNFTMQSTGTGSVEVSGVEVSPWRLDFTNFIQTGGTFTLSRNMSGAPNYTINVAGNFTMTGGTLTTSAAYATMNFNGTTGTQTFSKTGGTLSGTINFTVANGSTLDVGSSVITGSGSFNLNSGGTLVTANANGITSSGSSGSIQVSGTRTYNTGANYVYNGSAGQAAGNGLPATVKSITINTPGGISGTIPTTVDGYYNSLNNYIEIATSGNNISSYSISMTTPTLLPTRVNRQWALGGTFGGTKTITFFWTDTDDGGFDWTGKTPAVWIGTKKYVGTYDVSGTTNYVTVVVDANFSKGTYQIGQDTQDGTLPIELSSFTATITAQYFVQLHWITQSETDALGYLVFRSADAILAHAIQVSPLINATNTTTTASYIFTDSEVSSGTWYYWLQSLDLNGSFTYYGPVLANVSQEQGGEAPGIPVSTGISTVFPNPFNPNVTIKYDLKESLPVSFSIYNVRGQMVYSADLGTRLAGVHHLTWDAKGLAAGVYMIRMRAGDKLYGSKAVLSK